MKQNENSTAVNRLDKAPLYALCGALAALPFFYLPVTVEAYVSSRYLALAALAIFLAAFALVELTGRRELAAFRWTPADLFLALFTLTSLITIAASPNRRESLLAWTQLLSPAVVYAFVSRRAEREIVWMVRVIAASAALLGILTLGMAARAWLGVDKGGDMLFSMKGQLAAPLGGINFSAALLAFSIPATVSLLVSGERPRAWWPALFIQAAALAACLSRIALFSMALYGIAMILLLWKAGLGGKLRRGLAILAIGLVVVAGAGLLAGGRHVPRLYSNLMLVTDRSSRQGLGSFHMRLHWWLDTARLIKENPLGVGPGGFELVYPKYRTVSERFIEPETRLSTPHSDYLHTLAEAGAPGFLLFLALVGAAIGPLARAAARGGAERPAILAPAGMLFVGMTYGLFDFPLQMPASRTLFFTALGMASAFAVSAGGRELRLPPVSTLQKAAAVPFFLFAALNLMWFQNFAAQVYVLRQIQKQNSPEESLLEFKKAVHFNSGAKYAYPYAGQAYDRLGRHDEAAAMFRKALAVDPYDYNAVNFLGTTLARAGKSGEAMKEFRRAAEIYPAFSKPRLNMGILWLQRGETERAKEEFNHSLRLNPAQTQIYRELARIAIEENEFEEAARLLMKAMKLEPGNQEIFNELGRIHSAMNSHGWKKAGAGKTGGKKEPGAHP